MHRVFLKYQFMYRCQRDHVIVLRNPACYEIQSQMFNENTFAIWTYLSHSKHTLVGRQHYFFLKPPLLC